MITNWYLVQTKPNAHRIATRNLLRQGCQVFMPLLKLTRRTGNRFISNVSPLFPGYLFLGLDPDGQSTWRSLNSTLGVSRIISHSGKYRALPLSLIDELQNCCDPDGIFQTKRQIIKGDQVKIQKGPFAEFVATVDHLEPNARVWVLIELLGQKSQISVNENDLLQA
jgi:transcriptional antiterminator RfaH